MQLPTELNQLLLDIAAFSTIKRYRGMLPSKHALLFHPESIKELIEAGLIEKLVVSFACGAENTLFRLTEAGRALLQQRYDGQTAFGKQQADDAEALYYDELTAEQFEILQDIHHYSMIKRHGGIMPSEEVKNYDTKTINELFCNGLIIRVKVETRAQKKRKGVILSEKGARYLSELCAETPWYALEFNPRMQKTS